MNPQERGLVGPGGARLLQAAAAVGAAALLAGGRLWPERAWADLLWAGFYFSGLSLAALTFLAVQYVSSAGWSTVFRRVPEAMTGFLPLGAALFAVLLLGARELYPWAGALAADPVVAAKARWLNLPAFAARGALCWTAWIAFARAFVARSRAQDAAPEPGRPRGIVGLSAGFLVVFAVTFSAAAVDWVMSLEPRWTSTLYPWFLFAGAFASGLAALALLTLTLRRRGFLEGLNDHHVHDLGKYVFAFSCFWAYLWFSQFLLIWYSNLPDETTHYVTRLAGGWAPLFWLAPVLCFIVPFGMLLPASRKKRRRVLAGASACVLTGQALELYVLVMPTPGSRLAPNPMDAAAFIGVGALFVLACDRALRAAAPVPRNDLFLDESLHHHA